MEQIVEEYKKLMVKIKGLTYFIIFKLKRTAYIYE